MLNPNDRHIVRSLDGGWDATGAYAQRSSEHANVQAEAIQYAREVVRNAGGGEARIQGRDGCSRDSSIVAPANGPRLSGT